MNEIVRVLTRDDIPEMIRKIETCNSFYFANSKATMTKEEFLKYSLGIFAREKHLVHGHFVNNELTSMISSQELKSMPSYILKNYKHFSPSNYFSPKKNGWDMLLTSVIEHYEAKNIYSFYAMQGADETRNFNMRKLVKILWNYEYSIEEYVPANSQSKYELHNQTMYGGKTISADTIVNRYSCRQPFRK